MFKRSAKSVRPGRTEGGSVKRWASVLAVASVCVGCGGGEGAAPEATTVAEAPAATTEAPAARRSGCTSDGAASGSSPSSSRGPCSARRGGTGRPCTARVS